MQHLCLSGPDMNAADPGGEDDEEEPKEEEVSPTKPTKEGW